MNCGMDTKKSVTQSERDWIRNCYCGFNHILCRSCIQCKYWMFPYRILCWKNLVQPEERGKNEKSKCTLDIFEIDDQSFYYYQFWIRSSNFLLLLTTLSLQIYYYQLWVYKFITTNFEFEHQHFYYY